MLLLLLFLKLDIILITALLFPIKILNVKNKTKKKRVTNITSENLSIYIVR